MTLPNGHAQGWDWIEDYLFLTKDISAPPLYKLWSAIALVGATLQRRVWTRIEGGDNIYPNIFVFLVGKPGKGKGQAMKPIIRLTQQAINDKDKPIIFCASDNATKEAFIDDLADARVYDVATDSLEYHSLFLCCTEFSELMPEVDKSFMSALSKFWDNEDAYVERRRARKVKIIKIPCPNVTILSGIQPAYIGRFPIEIWERGFCARTIFIYAEEKVPRVLFGPGYNLETLDLQKRLVEDIHNRHGLIGFSPAAQDLMKTWEEEGYQPRPTHPRLEHYLERRSVNLGKIATISSMSRSHGQIEVDDLERAFGWMVEAEKPMAQMFGQMVSSPDTFVLDETLEHLRIQARFRPGGRFRKDEIYKYLSTKVDIHRVEQTFKTLEESDIITGDGRIYTLGSSTYGQKKT